MGNTKTNIIGKDVKLVDNGDGTNSLSVSNKETTDILTIMTAALTAGGNLKSALLEAIPAGDNNIGNVDIVTLPTVSSGGEAVEASHTRPDNISPYAANDVVGTDAATNMEFASVAPTAGQSVIITGAYMRIKVASLPNGMTSFRLHLYNVAPTAIADNAVYNCIDEDRSKYLGYITLPQPEDLGDNLLWTQVENINMVRKLANGSTSLYGVLQTVGAYTPTSQAVKEVGLCVLGR